MAENAYQGRLIKRIKKRWPCCIVLKNDSGYMQGISDLALFYHTKWAWLEVKDSEDEEAQPNQPYYVAVAERLSFGAFIFPSNEQVVLDELEQTFEHALCTCLPQPQQAQLDQLRGREIGPRVHGSPGVAPRKRAPRVRK